MKTGVSVAKVILLMIFGTLALRFCSSANAHGDGDYNTYDGHYYADPSGLCSDRFQLPEEYKNCREGISTLPPAWGCSFGSPFYTGTIWRYDISCDVGGDSWHNFPERHCPLGSVASGGGSCVVNNGSICDYGGHETSYLAESSPAQFVNVYDPVREQSCLWERVSSSSEGGCFNVTYQDTKWRRADEDAFGPGQLDSHTGDPIGSAPDPCAGQPTAPWPWVVGGFTGLPPTSQCPVGERFFTQWPYDEEAGADADLICFSGCKGATLPGALAPICFEDNGYCAGNVELNGDRCDGGEDYIAGTSDTQPGGSAGSAETNDLLRKIYDRQSQVSNRDALGTVAIIGAIGAGTAATVSAINELDGGGGDNSDLIEDADEFDAAAGIQGVTDGMAAEQQAIEDDIAGEELFDQPETSIKDDILAPLSFSPCVDFSFTVPGTVHQFSITCTATERVRLLLGWILNLGLAYSLFNLVTTRPQGGK